MTPIAGGIQAHDRFVLFQELNYRVQVVRLLSVRQRGTARQSGGHGPTYRVKPDHHSLSR
jgi:hypothetical protein